MEGRWATLAVRAQRDGVIDYREYEPGNPKWLLRERILLSSIEDSILSDHCHMLFPVIPPDARVELFDNILKYDLPWVSKEMAKTTQSDKLMEMYKQVMEQQTNG